MINFLLPTMKTKMINMRLGYVSNIDENENQNTTCHVMVSQLNKMILCCFLVLLIINHLPFKFQGRVINFQPFMFILLVPIVVHVFQMKETKREKSPPPPPPTHTHCLFLD